MYIIALYTLNYYEDKYFISLFVHFKHIIKIHYHHVYPDYYKKNLIIKVLKCIFFFEGAILMSTYVLKCIF